MLNKSYKLLIVGVGSIGSRHFQSISNMNLKKEIHILDKYEVIKKFRNKNNLDKSNKIYLHNSPSSVPKNLDIIIISTNSDIRAKITQDLIKIVKTKFIIFEKFLFQKENDYKTIISKLKKKKIKAWINCQRRMIPFYSILKKDLNKKVIKMTIIGNSWGFSSNSIHFLDLFYFLRSKEVRLKNIENNLEKKIFKSKRKGFIEFYGNLSINFLDKSNITFFNKKKSSKYYKIIIQSNKKKYEIIEKNKVIKLKVEKNKKKYFSIFKNYYTSQISSKIVSQILKYKKSFLPTLQVSSGYHLILLKIFLLHLKKTKNSRSERCQIT